jgi:tetratricopeptide (TPR) repeat protein
MTGQGLPGLTAKSVDYRLTRLLKDRGLYGRDVLAHGVAQALGRKRGNRVLVTGPSGMGKTALVRAIKGRIDELTDTKFSCYYECQSRAHSQGHFIANASKQLFEAMLGNPSTESAISTITKEIVKKHGWNVIDTVAGDLIDKVAPKTSSLLRAIIKDATKTDLRTDQRKTFDNLTQNEKDDAVAGFSGLLGEVGSKFKGLIVIDRLDAASEGVLGTVRALLANLPPSTSLLLAVNDEVPDGIDAREQIIIDFKRAGGKVVNLTGLEVRDIELWTKQAKCGFDISEIQQIRQVTGGRPQLIEEIISGSAIADIAPDLRYKSEEIYRRRLEKLSAPARELIKTLSVLPSGVGFNFELLQKLSGGQKLFALEEQIDELKRRNFLRDVPGLEEYLEFSHEIAQQQIRHLMSAAGRKAAAVAILAHTLPDALSSASASALYQAGLLIDTSGDRALLQEHANTIIDALVSSGSYLAALQILNTIKDKGIFARIDKKENQSPYLAFHTAEARILYNLGEYEKAITILNTLLALAQGDKLLELQSLRVGNLLRLNRINEAILLAGEVLATAKKRRKWPLYAVAACQLNTLMRDIGQYEQAAESILEAKEYLSSKRLANESRSAILRAVARSLAFVCPKHGIEAGAEALRLKGRGIAI